MCNSLAKRAIFLVLQLSFEKNPLCICQSNYATSEDDALPLAGLAEVVMLLMIDSSKDSRPCTAFCQKIKKANLSKGAQCSSDSDSLFLVINLLSGA